MGVDANISHVSIFSVFSFDEFHSIDYRKLLWQGVNVGSVAAILKEGFRITPFSVGNMGRGIHLTPDHAGSSWNGKLSLHYYLVIKVNFRSIILSVSNLSYYSHYTGSVISIFLPIFFL